MKVRRIVGLVIGASLLSIVAGVDDADAARRRCKKPPGVVECWKFIDRIGR